MKIKHKASFAKQVNLDTKISRSIRIFQIKTP